MLVTPPARSRVVGETEHDALSPAPLHTGVRLYSVWPVPVFLMLNTWDAGELAGLVAVLHEVLDSAPHVVFPD